MGRYRQDVDAGGGGDTDQHHSLASIGERCLHIILELIREEFAGHVARGDRVYSHGGVNPRPRGEYHNVVTSRPTRPIFTLSRLSRTCRALYFAVRNLPPQHGRRCTLSWTAGNLHLPSISYWSSLAGIYWFVPEYQQELFIQTVQQCLEHDSSELAHLRVCTALPSDIEERETLFCIIRFLGGLSLANADEIHHIPQDAASTQLLQDGFNTLSEIHLFKAYPYAAAKFEMRRWLVLLMPSRSQKAREEREQKESSMIASPAQHSETPIAIPPSSPQPSPTALSLFSLQAFFSQWDDFLRTPLFQRVKHLHLESGVSIPSLHGLPGLHTLILRRCDIDTIDLGAPVYDLHISECNTLQTARFGRVYQASIHACRALVTLTLGDLREGSIQHNSNLTTVNCFSPVIVALKFVANQQLKTVDGPNVIGFLQLSSSPLIKCISSLTYIHSLDVYRTWAAIPRAVLTSVVSLKIIHGSGSSSQMLSPLANLLLELPHLRQLHLQYCTAIQALRVTSPSSVSLHWCQDIESIDELETCSSLDIVHCPRLESVKALRYTGQLQISKCAMLSSMPSLEEVTGRLVVSDSCTQLLSLPRLHTAGELRLSRLPLLAALPTLKHVTKQLVLSYCSLLTDLSMLVSAPTCSISSCPALQAIPKLAQTSTLMLYQNSSLVAVPALSMVESAEISSCPAITDLPSLTHVKKQLLLVNLQALQSIPLLRIAPSVRIVGCPQLTALNGIEDSRRLTLENCESFTGCASLRTASVISFTSCSRLANLGHLESVDNFALRECPLITNLPPLHGVQHLVLVDCPQLRSISFVPPPCDSISSNETVVQTLPGLQQLTLERCAALTAVETFESVEKATISHCPRLKCALAAVLHATSLTIEKCQQLTGAPCLRSADVLSIDTCDAFRSLESLEQARLLNIANCPSLAAIGTRDSLLYIARAALRNCASLTYLPPIEFINRDDLESATTWPPHKNARISLAPPTIRPNDIESINAHHGCNHVSTSDRGFRKEVAIGPTNPSLGSVARAVPTTPLCALDLINAPVLRDLPLLSNVAELKIDSCPLLTKLPALTSVVSLTVHNCNSLKDINTLGAALEFISVAHCAELEFVHNVSTAAVLQFSHLPSLKTICDFSVAREVDLDDLPLLLHLPTFVNLERASITNVPQARLFAPAFLSSRMSELVILNCPKMTPILSEQVMATTLRLAAINWHGQMPTSLESLEALSLDMCDTVTVISGLQNISNITISRCPQLQRVSGLRNISLVSIASCAELHEISTEADVAELVVENCNALVNLTFPQHQTAMVLRLANCGHPNLVDPVHALVADAASPTRNLHASSLFLENTSISALAHVQNAKRVCVRSCSALAELHDLSLINRLEVIGCQGELRHLHHLADIETLKIDNTAISRLSDFTSITRIQLRNVHALTSVTALSHIESLDLSRCSALTELAQISHVTRVRVCGCCNLVSISDVSSIILLDASECTSLKELSNFTEVGTFIVTNIPMLLCRTQLEGTALAVAREIIDTETDDGYDPAPEDMNFQLAEDLFPLRDKYDGIDCIRFGDDSFDFALFYSDD